MTAGSLDFWTLGSVIWRRKWSILFCALAAAIAAVGIAVSLPARFASEGGLVVESQRLNIPELGIQANQTADGTADAVATAIDVLSSRGTLESVVRDLNLTHAADLQPAMRLPAGLDAVARLPRVWLETLLAAVNDWRERDRQPDRAASVPDAPARADDAALTYLQRHLKVQANEHSNLLTIQFEAGSPEISAAVVNALMANYIANDIAARRNQLRQANEWLTQRAADLRHELDADDAKINGYLKLHEIGQLQGGSVAVVQLSATRDRLAAARDSLARIEASMDAARGGGGATAPQVLASPVVQALRQREGDLMQRLAALPPVHPERQKLEDEIRSVRAQIAGETGKIIAGLAHDADVARSNVQQLQQAADKAAADARAASVAQVDYEQLVHEADAKRQVYNSFVARADQTRLATMQFPSARVQFQATADAVPNRASPVMLGFLGLFAGAILASAGTVSGHLLRRRVLATSDITAATGLPVYGSLPEIRLPRGPSLSRLAPPPHRSQSLFEETLRAVWLSMHSMTPKSTCTTVVVTSSEVSEGKTTVAAALARRVAEDGFRVLLIDADLRRGVAASHGGAKPASDLEAVLTGAVKFDDAVMVEPKSDLHCLMSGGASANPIRLLASRAFKELLASARRDYDLVVLDAPPMMRVADAALLSEECLFTLFVVGYGQVSGRIVAEAISRFPRDGDNQILPVLTRVPARRLDRLDYYGGYGGPREAPLVHGKSEPGARLPPRGAPIHSGGALRLVPRRTGTEMQASDMVE